jgi:hypothetical protein
LRESVRVRDGEAGADNPNATAIKYGTDSVHMLAR